jgi:hypothetical protein
VPTVAFRGEGGRFRDTLISDGPLRGFGEFLPMAKVDVERGIKEKGADLKNFFKDMKGVLEEWKFSVEDTKEGTRVEIHAIALIRRPKGDDDR